MPLSTVTVTGGASGWTNPDGTVPGGTVTFQPVQSLTGGGYILAAEPVVVSLANGNISKQLANNSQLTSLQYLVTEQIVGATNPAPYVITPSGTTLDLSTAPRGTVSATNPLYVQASTLGQPSGVATLDNGGLVPANQLPAFVSSSTLGQPNGVATLDGSGQVTSSQLAGMTATTPTDVGYKSWNYDPVSAVNTSAPSSGVLYLMRLQIRNTDTVTKVWMAVASSAGIALTSGQNFLGLYNSTGALVRSTADLTATLSASGEQGYNLASAASVTPGFYWVGLLLNGTTMPTFVRASGAVQGLGNGPSATATKRFAQYGTGLTALPSALTLANLTNPVLTFWVGVS